MKKRVTKPAKAKRTARGNLGKVSNHERQRRAAENLAKGMSATQAMVEAGYSKFYANSEGYKVVKKPYIQSIFTEAIQRVMEKNQKTFDDIVTPYVKALDAPMIVKSMTEGIATIAKDPETQEVLPDHKTRMDAADRLIELHGARDKQPPEGDGTFTLEQLIDAMEKVKA